MLVLPQLKKGENMINKVSFTGRETLLTGNLAKPVEQQVIKASTYIEEKVAPKVAETSEQALSRIYSSPFAPIEQVAQTTQDVGKILNFFG